jgi:hypothetical protein
VHVRGVCGHGGKAAQREGRGDATHADDSMSKLRHYAAASTTRQCHVGEDPWERLQPGACAPELLCCMGVVEVATAPRKA